MNRTEKQAFIDQVKAEVADAGVVVVTHYHGLTVEEITKLRRQMREAGASFKVTKNTLTKLAIKDTPFAHLEESFSGPTAIAYSEDPVAAAKVAVSFSKEHEQLKVVAGGLGEKPLNADEIKALATMPSLDELRAKIISVIQTPATRIAGVLQAPPGQLARVLHAKSQKSE